MFEGQTLATQRAQEVERGWTDLEKLSPLTYSTVEVVVIHRPNGTSDPLLWEILETRRRSDRGVVDCRGRWQGKWGTQVRPPVDKSAHQAARRCIGEFFGENFDGELYFAGITGPWVHKAEAGHDQRGFFLRILPEQCESTPWEGKIYAFDAKNREFDQDSGHKNVHSGEDGAGPYWIRLRDLIEKRGNDSAYLHWLVVCLAVRALDDPKGHDTEPRYWSPKPNEVEDAYRFFTEKRKNVEGYE